MMGIYAYIDTKDNSVVYVGKDSYIEENRRHIDHMKPANYNRQRINQILQNNPHRYEYKPIFVFDDISQTELNHLEIQQIALFNPKFNFTKGGEGIKGFKHSEETRKRMREAHKGVYPSTETRKRMSKSQKGNYHSDESCKKMSEFWNTTGYYRVSKIKNSEVKQGFYWCYSCTKKGKRTRISSVNLEELKQKVEAKGLEWFKFEEVDLE